MNPVVEMDSREKGAKRKMGQRTFLQSFFFFTSSNILYSQQVKHESKSVGGKMRTALFQSNDQKQYLDSREKKAFYLITKVLRN